MPESTRRSFLQATAAVASSTAASVYVAGQEKTTQPPSTIRIAVMGINGRGTQLIDGLAKLPSVEITHLCDPDSSVVPRGLNVLRHHGRTEPTVVKDFRTVLDDPKVDVLVCAAPDHWHALATILACQAGKDVYVERPVSHTVVEGRRMVQAARKYERIVAAGMQRRSATEIVQAIETVHSGRLGDVNFVRAWISSSGSNIGHRRVSSVPKSLDFDLWCGPAPNNGYRDNLVHRHWRLRWDYGGGECAHAGVDALDIARWGMQIDWPTIVSCGGNKYFFDDDRDTPDTQIALFDSPNGSISWEHRTATHRGIEGSRFGIAFYGSEATLIVKSSGWQLYRGEELLENHRGKSYDRAHLENFLDCVRTRKKPTSEIEDGHRSATFSHLANIAWRTRSTLRFDGKSETIDENSDANRLLARSYRKGYELPEFKS